MEMFGFAYSVDQNTVVRGGYGIFFGFLGQQANSSNSLIQSGFSQTTPLVASLDEGLTFAANLSNPFPEGIRQPSGASAGLNTFLGQSVSFYNEKPSTPYFQIWSFTVQRSLFWGGVSPYQPMSSIVFSFGLWMLPR